MPLYKRKPIALVEKPDDLNPTELVFQIRFTKEVFRDYKEYLKRINLYRKRVWTCKATGKGNLTYEEAVVSEGKASKRIQNIPIQCVDPILRDVQFSMLNLKDLVHSIAAKFQGPFSVGTELYGKKDGRRHLCKIIKVVEDAHETQYEIEWLDGDQKMNGNALLNGDELTEKNPLFSKLVLKSFIKDSTYQSHPWVLHDNIAKKHGIPTSLPEELKPNCSVQNGLIVRNRKRRRVEEPQKTLEANEKDIKVYMRRHKLTSESYSLPVKSSDGVNPQDESIKYPIEDLLVQPSGEDGLTERPSPCRDFNVPLNCVGDLLMITQITWTEYLCDFLETTRSAELTMPLSTIKRGHYALLEINVKLAIFRELIAQVLETDTVRDRLDEFVEERQALSAARRDEALDEGKKRREEKERKKLEATGKEVQDVRKLKSVVIRENSDKKVGSRQNHSSGTSENEQGDITDKKNAKKRMIEINTSSDDINNPSKREIHKLMKNEVKESIEMKSAEERKEFLEREIERRSIRTSPLGRDRNYCRYWFFRRDGRIFVENSESTQWGYYQTKEEFDALIGSLNNKGVREKALKKQLQKFYNKICTELQKRSKEATQRIEMEDALVRRSTRVRAPPRGNPLHSFLKYVNKWKDI
ncbi:hypothetical protein OROHE_017153 [Orobanche hederae]